MGQTLRLEVFIRNKFIIFATIGLLACFGCAGKPVAAVAEGDAARIDRTLVRETVVYESGAKDGAVVPDVSAPRLRAIWVPERQENGRLIEAHREWTLEGDVAILGIPKTQRKSK